MKKLLIILLAVALIFVTAVGCASTNIAAPAETPAPTAEPAADTPAPAGETALRAHVDMEALHALYPGDAVYATVGEREITWDEYYEWLGTYILSAESYMDSMAYYGMDMSWDSDYTNDANMADYIVSNLNDNLRAYTGIDLFAAQNGISISEAELDAQRAEDIASALGEGAGDEDWAALLVANFMTEGTYRAQARARLELTRLQEALYGENGEKLSAASLQHYIEDQGYLHCNHILFATVDLDTRDALDEEVAAAKKAQAEEFAAELQAIGDRDQLLARFAELKEEYCEDSGKVYYPDGYLFTPGTMVEVFENTTRELRDYQVSDPVLSPYGYHIIIRLPIDADTALETGGTIGQAASSEIMAADLDQVVDALDFTLAPGMAPVSLLAFLVSTVEK